MIKSLKGKLSLIYFCLVLVIAIIGAVSAINLYRLSKSINGLMTENYKSIKASSYMLEAINNQDSAILTYINIDRQKGIDLFTQNANAFSSWYNIEFNNITELGEKECVERVNNYYVNNTKLFSELQEIRNSGGLDKAVAFYNSTIIPNLDKLKEEIRQISLINEKAMFYKKDNATNSANRYMYIVLLLTSFAVIGGFIFSRYFTNKFLGPIYSLTSSISLVKAGELNQQIDINTNDEIGKLAQEFNNMTKRLQKFEQSTLGQLLDEKNKTLTIVKSISYPLIVLDTNYRFILLNKACEKFFDIQEDKIINKHFLEAIRDGELFKHISSVLEENEDYKEKIFYLKSNDDYYFNVVITTIKDIDKNIAGLIVAFQDITELKKLEKIKTDFLATISHEFKTPLTSIIMGTSMILEESMGTLNDEQKSIMHTIEEDETALSNLVSNLLELSKIESDKAIFNIKPCSIEEVINTSMKQFYEQAQRKNIKLNCEISSNLPKVLADFEKITWTINNLITNALKYTSPGDEILVSANLSSGKINVSVKDTGVGIPIEFQEKIFDRFIQVEDHDLEIRGTGLGLAIVKEIIQAHNGEIRCDSQPKIGSKFTFTLPLSEEAV